MADSQGVTYNAFFYGTLMAREVFNRVCYRMSPLDKKFLAELHPFKPAILHGYCRRRVQFADYPGIVSKALCALPGLIKACVRGVYVTGLTQQNLANLNFFEGDQYKREKVKVRLLSEVGDDKGHGNIEGEEVECEVYVFTEPEYLEDKEWDFEEFRNEKLQFWSGEDWGDDDGYEYDDNEDLADGNAVKEDDSDFVIVNGYEKEAAAFVFCRQMLVGNGQALAHSCE
ncbi:AIG2-like family-domain-containing protein [Xylariaceae sp. FL0255]|nr:AIG2-like family-domain-containing protein [Xylariaceae sp. FL0255]